MYYRKERMETVQEFWGVVGIKFKHSCFYVSESFLKFDSISGSQDIPCSETNADYFQRHPSLTHTYAEILQINTENFTYCTPRKHHDKGNQV